MRQARAFLVVCLGILALAVACHFGATTATAQAPGNPVVGFGSFIGNITAVTSNGDVYYCMRSDGSGPWSLKGNIFSGATPAQSTTFGQLKARYAK
jgi:hypothetical protein